MINKKNGAIVEPEGCCHSEMNDGKDLEAPISKCLVASRIC